MSAPPSFQQRQLDITTGPPTPILPSSPPNSAPYVNVVPLSPLVVTTDAAIQHITDVGSGLEKWRWLSSHWQGTIRPDIIIEVHHQQEGLQDEEVFLHCRWLCKRHFHCLSEEERSCIDFKAAQEDRV